MNDEMKKDYADSIRFWNEAFRLEAEGEAEKQEPKETAPSEKLYQACVSLGNAERLLDYGCGDGWASVIAALSGCASVHAVDVNENAVRAAAKNAEVYGVSDRVKAEYVTPDWIAGEETARYDAVFCSNVLDVVPREVSERIIREIARVLKPSGRAVVGLNHYLPPREDPARGMTVKESDHLYVNGILRLFSRTDEEWAEAFGPYFTVERLLHFGWPQEQTERRRLFFLTK